MPYQSRSNSHMYFLLISYFSSFLLLPVCLLLFVAVWRFGICSSLFMKLMVFYVFKIFHKCQSFQYEAPIPRLADFDPFFLAISNISDIYRFFNWLKKREKCLLLYGLTYLHSYIHTYLRTYLLYFLLTYALIALLTYLLTYLLFYSLIFFYLITGLHTYLITYRLVNFSTWIHETWCITINENIF